MNYNIWILILNLILLSATARKSHIFVVPIDPPIDPLKENPNIQHLTIYEKIQLSLLEYELTLLYGTTYVTQYYNF